MELDKEKLENALFVEKQRKLAELREDLNTAITLFNEIKEELKPDQVVLGLIFPTILGEVRNMRSHPVLLLAGPGIFPSDKKQPKRIRKSGE